ncbi:MAG: hypothetical protein WC279_09725 [Sulfurimonas sp.]|jgi:hypothetical protein
MSKNKASFTRALPQQMPEQGLNMSVGNFAFLQNTISIIAKKAQYDKY